ncbi:TetR/AcrR family transcriptional regulator [Peribacillus kribbensis]|uniref:TetR/AcrR family transcriptional regulator n=1 Tax=Peribacillus kribbensis TaxID=356658 RepID=UPI000410FA85|nr:TetR/AcrR family transcriptional regulator [Peribacillus kribbensis]
MNSRKQQVINRAHQLFIEKGFQATSIQDILDYSGISKGTFYNYFSSKSELLIAIFTSLSQRIDQERNELLIGQDPSNKEIFIQQIELQMEFNQKHKLLTLFEEVFVSNDPFLKDFLNQMKMMYIRWIYNRLVDLFEESMRPFLLDCAIMFTGMLHNNIHFYFLAHPSLRDFRKVIQYSVNRLEGLVVDAAKHGEHLLTPSIWDKWLPGCPTFEEGFKKKLANSINELKMEIHDGKRIELLDFIQEEVTHSKIPRKFLIEAVLSSLENQQETGWNRKLDSLRDMIGRFFAGQEAI